MVDAPADDDEFGLTDGRFRYFKLWTMDRSVVSGYRGWGSSIEIQTQGTVPSTDGSNSLSLGGLAAFGAGKELSIFPSLIASSVWSNDLDDHLGFALRGDLFITYKPEWAWDGAYLKVTPRYSYGVSDVLEGDRSFSVESTLGGAITENKQWWWDVQWRIFFSDAIIRATSGSESGLATEQSLFLSFTYFF